MNNLTAAQQLLISKFKPDESAVLPKGKYPVEEFTVTFVGEVNVSEDTEAQNSVPWKKIALFLLEDMTASEAVKVAKKAIDSGMSKEDEEVLELKIKSKLALKLGRTPRKGAVRGYVLARIFESSKG